MKYFDKPKKIFIKTFCFESGLWYLGWSLYKTLAGEGHEVYFLPKGRYVNEENRFVRKYPEPTNKDEFPQEFILSASNQIPVRNMILNHVNRHQPDVIISLETLMQTSQWISFVKGRHNIKVIDVPMIEWVTPSYLKGQSYKAFDEIWTVTDFTHKVFKEHGYSNLRRLDWDFVDRQLFFEDSSVFSPPGIHFYHPGSLNQEHTSKNTNLVIKAFDKILNDGYEVSLTITGKIHSKELSNIIDKHTNIHVIDKLLSRMELANLYNNIDCVVAPSSKEGLGLSLFEAQACGCDLITTDAPPMNAHRTKYLCEIERPKIDGTLVPKAILNVDSIYQQIKNVCEDKK
jgi:glycosyltransferase involved in cell wall biosynthesis